MKILLLSAIAAMAISTFVYKEKTNTNNASKNTQAINENKNNQYLEEETKHLLEPGGDVGSDRHYYEDIDSGDDEPDHAHIIENDNVTITGTVREYSWWEQYISNPLGGNKTGSIDQDWYRFSSERRSRYHFTFNAPNNGYKLSVRKYRGRKGFNEGYGCKEGEEMMVLNGSSSSKYTYLGSGTYFIKVTVIDKSYIVKNEDYTITMDVENFAETPIPLTGTNSYTKNYKLALWQNDYSPDNADRNGKSGQTLEEDWNAEMAQYYKDYLDPIFSSNSEKYIDTIVYVWDKNVLSDLYNILTKADELIDKALKENKISQVKGINVFWDNLAGFGIDLVGCIPVASEAISFMSMTADGIQTVLSLCDYCFADVSKIENYEYNLGKFIGGLKATCFAAANSNVPDQVVCIPKYSYIARETIFVSKSSCRFADVWYATFAVPDYWYRPDYNYNDGNISNYQTMMNNGKSYHGKISVFKNGQEFANYTHHSLAEYIHGDLSDMPTEYPELDSITLSGNQKTIFEVGSQFDSSGLLVEAHYIGQASRYVTNYDIDSNHVCLTSPGAYTVYVSYTEADITKHASYVVFVVPQATSQTLVETIEIDFNADDLEFYSGHGHTWYYLDRTIEIPHTPNLELDTLQIIGATAESDFEFLSIDAYQIYDWEVRVVANTEFSDAYGQIKILYTVNSNVPIVPDPSLESISLSGDYVTQINVGEAINTDNIVVTAHYDDGSSAIVENYIIDTNDVDPTCPDTYTIFIYYSENGVTKYTSYNYQVLELAPVVESITLSGDYKTEMTVGEEIDTSNLIVIAHYDNNEEYQIADFVVDTNDVDPTCPDTYTIWVSYTENDVTVSTSYTMTVLPQLSELESISLSGSYQKLFYLGDYFNYEGLIVNANYSDGTTNQVTNFTIDIPDMNSTGTKVVTVSYTEGEVTQTATYKIKVRAPLVPSLYLLESITLEGKYKTNFKAGSEFSYDGLVVIAHYSGKKEDQVVEKFDVDYSRVNMRRPGEYPVVVSYTENGITKTATYTVNVAPKGIDPDFPIGKGF